MVNTARTRGGAARMAATLADAMNSSDENIRAVLYHADDVFLDNGFHGLQKQASRSINSLLARLGGSLCITDLGFADDVIQLSAQADILHLHNLHGYYLNYPKLLTAWRNRPIVWTWHDMWGATGRCGFSGTCERWKSGCMTCSDKSLYPASWFDFAASEFREKKILFSSLKNLWIVSPSEWLSDIAANSGFDRSRIKTIPNPVDTRKFKFIKKDVARKQLGLPADKFTALFVASDCGDPRKGYRDFSAAISASTTYAIAVGKPPSSASEMINHVGILVDQSQINLYYAAADVMVIPSYSDNYPNTVIESMMSGTPVIGYAEGGIPSQLDAPFCQLVTKGDISGLRNAIIEQSRTYQKTSEMAEKLSSLACERWAPDSARDLYVKLYREALSHSGAESAIV